MAGDTLEREADEQQGEPEAPPSDEATPEYREWLAAAYDTDVHEHWLKLFEDLALGAMKAPERGMALEIGCATGRATERILRMLPPRMRLVAQEDRSFLLDRARARLADHVGARLFFNSDALPRLRYDARVFTLAFSNLTWWERPDADTLLLEIARVLDDDGTLVLTAPLAGTFRQIIDLIHEVLVKLDLTSRLGPALAALGRAFPAAEAWSAAIERAGFGDVRVERLQTDRMFASSQRLFASTVTQARWMAIFKRHFEDETARIIWHLRRMLDSYWADSPFPISLVAGCLLARKLPVSVAAGRPRAPIEERPVSARDGITGEIRVSEGAGGFASGDSIADALLGSPATRPSVPPEPIDVEPVEEAAGDAWRAPSDLEGDIVALDADDIESAEPYVPDEGDLHPASELPAVVPVDLEDPRGRRIDPVDLENSRGRRIDPVDLENSRGRRIDPVDLENSRGRRIDPVDLGKPQIERVEPVDLEHPAAEPSEDDGGPKLDFDWDEDEGDK